MIRRLLVAGVLAVAVASARGAGTEVPVFELDAAWPKLPNNWVLGQTPGVAVDRHDHIWVLHRPRTVPEAQRAQAAPPLLEFDADGTFLRGWGGPGAGFDWPDSEHGMFVDYKDNVWIGGSSPTSHVADQAVGRHAAEVHERRKVPAADRRPRQEQGQRRHGERQQAGRRVRRSEDQRAVRGRRLRQPPCVVFDADTLAFKRMWGAFGNAPVDVRAPPRGRPRRRAVHRRRPGPRPVRQPDARGEGVERRPRLRGRPAEPPHSGVHAGRGSSSRRRSSTAPVRPTARWRASRSRPTRRSGSCTSPTTATRTSS